VSGLRRAVILLARATGWALAEIMDMDLDDFWAWLKDAEAVGTEIAEAVRP
jgi:hypothetical protein